MDNIPERILWLLGRVSDQRSRRIAQHLNVPEWSVHAALQQLEREGVVERATIQRKQGAITVYRLSVPTPNRARVIGNPERDYCFSTYTLKPTGLTATVIPSSGGP